MLAHPSNMETEALDRAAPRQNSQLTSTATPNPVYLSLGLPPISNPRAVITPGFGSMHPERDPSRHLALGHGTWNATIVYIQSDLHIEVIHRKCYISWKHSFRGKPLIWAITAAACQAFLLLGFDQGVMAGLIGADNPFGTYFNSPDANIIICYFVGEKFGRRAMLMARGSIMIIGAIILGTSINVAMLIAGRIITGVGNGMNSSTASVYLSQCAPASYRGVLLTLQGTLTITGVVIAYWMDYGTSFSSTDFQWRFPLAL
ncbi:putative major facilitator, sugar transporter, major facilitator superfamily [Septoria linicola]|nr:putative major facilitator, sugar transporter, major facilitator superfamily [Septoria linicola]